MWGCVIAVAYHTPARGVAPCGRPGRLPGHGWLEVELPVRGRWSGLVVVGLVGVGEGVEGMEHADASTPRAAGRSTSVCPVRGRGRHAWPGAGGRAVSGFGGGMCRGVMASDQFTEKLIFRDAACHVSLKIGRRLPMLLPEMPTPGRPAIRLGSGYLARSCGSAVAVAASRPDW